MKRVFIDVGYNKGQSIDHFIRIVPDYDEYEIHAFEPDSRNFRHFDKHQDRCNIQFHKEVVWVFDGEVTFHISRESFGNTVIKEKGNLIDSKMLPCVDLVKFIKDNYTIEDYIILKLDIEGGEYKLLQHMIDTQCMAYIDELFVEFHKDKVAKSLVEGEHENLVNALRELGYKYVDIPWESDTIKLSMIKLYESC